MNIQFLVEANRRNIRTLQVLPTLFTETMYPKKGFVYLIHNRGTKHKVYVKMAGGNCLKLYEAEWRAFLDDSKYTEVATFHFIRQEEDYYYVTAYNNDGYELSGYNLNMVGYRQRRCLVTLEHVEESPPIPCGFLTNTQNPEFRVYVSGVLVATVTHHEIYLLDEERHVHLLGGQGWHILVQLENLIVGTRLVLTNLCSNSVSLMPFGAIGLEMRQDMVERMVQNSRKPFVKSKIDKDKRMEHMCEWDRHTEHENEENCFYAPILAYVTDRGRLNIPHDFVKAHEMWKYHNAILRYSEEEESYVDVDRDFHSDRPNSKNHVTIKCRWSEIFELCQWEPNKMVRFKLVETVEDVQVSLLSRKPILIPVFHMC